MIKGHNETFFENKFLLSGSGLKVSIGQVNISILNQINQSSIHFNKDILSLHNIL